jgi:hypothetical protein
MKLCCRCNIEKELIEFFKDKSKKDGLTTWCKKCKKESDKRHRENHKEKIKLQKHEYYLSNKIVFNQKGKEHRQQNEEKYKEWGREFRNQNKDKIRDYQREYKQVNRDRINQNEKNRKHNDSSYKLLCNLRVRINRALKLNSKSDHTLELLGCSINELKQHLEQQFTEGMAWDNYGKFGWHIDHIIPCSSFDFNDFNQQKKCFHYTNLQPLWWNDNLSKSDRII